MPGYEASAWQGIGAPKNTPAEIIDRFNKEINAGPADPKLKTRLADLGGVPMPMKPADFGKFIAEETQWRRPDLKFQTNKKTADIPPAGRFLGRATDG